MRNLAIPSILLAVLYPGPLQADALEECRKVLSVFDALGLPDPRGRELVLYNAGEWTQFGGETPSLSFHYHLGWVLSESEELIELAEDNLTTATHRKKGLHLPEDWDRLRGTLPPGQPLPGEKKALDFVEHCRGLLRIGVRKDRPDLDHFSHGGLPRSIEAALHGFWALRRGEERLAVELVELARAAVVEEAPKEGTDLGKAIRAALAGNLRWQAITSANAGASRSELLRTWRKIAEVAPGGRDREAEEMVIQYQGLLEGDRRFRDPAQEEMARMSPRERARVWIHRLRDLAATQWGQPGGVYVLGSWAGMRDGGPNPADELVKLGWDALPEVIAHLDDPRPTRSMGYWRNFAPDSYYLFRHGDCCQQVFEAITGFGIYERTSTSGAMVKDGQASGARAKAEEWWGKHGKGGADQYFLGMLEGAGAGYAAGSLLKMAPRKHLPRIIEVLKEGEQGVRNKLLPAALRHLGKEEEKLIESFLDEEELEVVLSAAGWLWRKCGSDKGARRVLDKLLETSGESPQYRHLSTAFDLLAEVRRPFAVEGICRLARSKSVELRMHSLRAAARFPCTVVGESLLAQLDDKAETGWSSGYPLRFCDVAAESLLGILELEERIPYRGPADERDRAIETLKAWWRENAAGIDWNHLERKARGEIIRDSLGMRLVRLPEGELTMGSSHEDPPGGAPRRVKLLRPFFIGMHEVTVSQFRRFAEEAGYRTEAEKDGKGADGLREGKWLTAPEFNWKDMGYQRADDEPVVNVTWNDSRAFCRWMSQRERRTYRLPTEAEWEYACRAGSEAADPRGTDPALRDEHAWHAGNAGDRPHRVGLLKPNAFGVHDMLGNACEYCQDRSSDTPDAAGPRDPLAGDERVVRGGGWGTDPIHCRPAFRGSASPDHRSRFHGFRVVLEERAASEEQGD